MTIPITTTTTTSSSAISRSNLPAQPLRQYTKPVPSMYAAYVPTHPRLFRVKLGRSAENAANGEQAVRDDDAFDSCLIAEKVGSASLACFFGTTPMDG